MTAATLMTSDIVTLRADDSIAYGLRLMCKHGVHNLPVVDENGAFIGLFSLRRLSSELLPKAAKLGEDNLLMHMDINFMPDSTDQLSERMIALGSKTVSSMLEKESKLRFCSPDTPLPELLLLLHENPTSLPVVIIEGKKKKLAGMVSNWDVLTKMVVNLLGGDTESVSCKHGPQQGHDD